MILYKIFRFLLSNCTYIISVFGKRLYLGLEWHTKNDCVAIKIVSWADHSCIVPSPIDLSINRVTQCIFIRSVLRYFLPYAMKETKTPSGLLKMDPNTIRIHRKILCKSYCIRDYSKGQHYIKN